MITNGYKHKQKQKILKIDCENDLFQMSPIDYSLVPEQVYVYLKFQMDFGDLV